MSEPREGQPGLPEHEAYLFDRSGGVDPAVARLEETLAPARRTLGVEDLLRRRAAGKRVLVGGMAAAAVVTLLGAVAIVAALRPAAGKQGVPREEIVKKVEAEKTTEVVHAPRETVSAWQLAMVKGGVTLGAVDFEKVPVASEGRWLRSGEGEGVAKNADGVSITVGAGTNVRLAERGKSDVWEPGVWVEGGTLEIETSNQQQARVGIAGGEARLGMDSALRIVASGKGPAMFEALRGEVVIDGHGASTRLLAGMRCEVAGLEGPKLARPAGEKSRIGEIVGHLEMALAGRTKERPEAALRRFLDAAGVEDAAVLWNVAARTTGAEQSLTLKRMEQLFAGTKRAMPTPEKVVDAEYLERLWGFVAGR